MGMLWTVIGSWAALGAFGLLSGAWKGGGFFEYVVILLLFFGPLALMIAFVLKRNANRSARFNALVQAAGFTGANGFEHREEASGIVLNRERKVLGVLSGSSWKVYPFTDVREWETNQQTALMGSNHAANFANEALAKAATGFFVTVRDVDTPRWRIAMKDAQQQARWMEILRQEINQQ